MIKDFTHKPVLLNETIENLAVKPDGIYIDATFGRGGHANEILKRLSSKGKLLVLDKDLEAIAQAKSIQDERIEVIHSSFRHLKKIVEERGLIKKIDGVLLDLGISSPQVDDAKRGFSFLHDGPLDMRMDTTNTLTAATWLQNVREKELVEVLRTYGEERYSRRIANAIIRARENKKITTTGELAEIVSKAHPRWEKHKHPATRVFQALRIMVNNELSDLEQCLKEILDVLKISGRLLIITFHSLEDMIVKDFIDKNIGKCSLPREVPITRDKLQQRIKRIGKAIRASEAEVNENPRSRSAKLYVIEVITN